MARISSAHHIFGIEHLLGELGNVKGSVLLGSSWGEGGEPNHKEVQPRKRNKIDSQFSKVGVQLAWESERASNSAHGGWDQMVKVTVGGSGEFESPEADIVEGLIVDDHALVSVFD